MSINCVRNIKDANIEPCPQLNIFTGKNGSGKTALLEAIHLLARAKSFRTSRIKEVIQFNQPALRVIARISNKENHRIPTGIEKSYSNTTIRFNQKTLRTVSKQAQNIPLILITPDSQTLITGAPKQRRHWLDWAMFHVEPAYIKIWKNYQKSLRNRNILLKRGCSNQQLDSWEGSMSDAAGLLDRLRKKFILQLQQQLLITTQGVFTWTPVLLFNNGSPEGVVFREYLADQREQDRQAGYTRFGPHKADIGFMVGDHPLSQSFSRGQIKRFINALLLAQARTYERIIGEKPVFLVDDYTAELDAEAQAEILSSLLSYGGQIFLTLTEADKDCFLNSDASVFHVEHGNIKSGRTGKFE